MSLSLSLRNKPSVIADNISSNSSSEEVDKEEEEEELWLVCLICKSAFGDEDSIRKHRMRVHGLKSSSWLRLSKWDLLPRIPLRRLNIIYPDLRNHNSMGSVPKSRRKIQRPISKYFLRRDQVEDKSKIRLNQMRRQICTKYSNNQMFTRLQNTAAITSTALRSRSLVKQQPGIAINGKVNSVMKAHDKIEPGILGVYDNHGDESGTSSSTTLEIMTNTTNHPHHRQQLQSRVRSPRKLKLANRIKITQIRRKLAKEFKLFNCDVCGLSCADAYDLKKHTKTKRHLYKIQLGLLNNCRQLKVDLRRLEEQQQGLGSKLFNCGLCEAVFRREYDLRRHYKTKKHRDAWKHGIKALKTNKKSNQILHSTNDGKYYEKNEKANGELDNFPSIQIQSISTRANDTNQINHQVKQVSRKIYRHKKDKYRIQKLKQIQARKFAKKSKLFSCALCGSWFGSDHHLIRHYGTNKHLDNVKNQNTNGQLQQQHVRIEIVETSSDEEEKANCQELNHNEEAMLCKTVQEFQHKDFLIPEFIIDDNDSLSQIKQENYISDSILQYENEIMDQEDDQDLQELNCTVLKQEPRSVEFNDDDEDDGLQTSIQDQFHALDDTLSLINSSLSQNSGEEDDQGQVEIVETFPLSDEYPQQFNTNIASSLEPDEEGEHQNTTSTISNTVVDDDDGLTIEYDTGFGAQVYACKYCGYKCHDGASWKNHTNTHSHQYIVSHKCDDWNLYCQLCGIKCTNIHALVRHKQSGLHLANKTTNAADSGSPRSSINGAKAGLLCEVCNTTYTELRNLKKHFKTKVHKLRLKYLHGKPNPIVKNIKSSASVSSSGGQMNGIGSTKSKYTCATCSNKIFLSKRDLVRHYETELHQNRAKYDTLVVGLEEQKSFTLSCADCRKRFIHPYDLSIHLTSQKHLRISASQGVINE